MGVHNLKAEPRESTNGHSFVIVRAPPTAEKGGKSRLWLLAALLLRGGFALVMPGAFTTSGHFVFLPDTADFPTAYTSHWDDFRWWYSVAIAANLAVMILSRMLLPLLLPTSWAAMVKESPYKAISVPKNVTEWFPACVVFPLALSPVRVITRAALAEPAMALYLPAPSGVWCATGAAVGYMTFDCTLLLLFRRTMISSMKTPMYLQMWAHHLLSMFIWPYGLHTSCACVFIAWFLLSEGSNLFLNCRTLLIKFNAGSGFKFAIANGLFGLSFLILRMVPMPLFLAFWYGIDWSRTTWLTFAMSAVSTPLPVFLNIFWFNQILAGALGKPKKKSS